MNFEGDLNSMLNPEFGSKRKLKQNEASGNENKQAAEVLVEIAVVGNAENS